MFTWMLFSLSSPIVGFLSDLIEGGIPSYLFKKKQTSFCIIGTAFIPGKSSQLGKIQIRKHLCHWEASSQMHTCSDYIPYEWINYKLCV